METGKPWETRYRDSLNARIRGALLNVEVFRSPREALILIELSGAIKAPYDRAGIGPHPTSPRTHGFR